MRTLAKQNLEDIAVGCSFLGTGGGGSFARGMQRVYEDLQAGLTFKLMSPEEMQDDDYAAATYGVGSTAPPTDEQKQRYAKLPHIEERSTTAAFRLLQRYMQKNFVSTIAGEIGPGNTIAAMSAAAHIGIAQLDADTVGRAAPEIDQNAVLAEGLAITPAAGVTQYGDEMILPKVATTSREEDLFRAASMVSMGIGVADTPLAGKDAKRKGCWCRDPSAMPRKSDEPIAPRSKQVRMRFRLCCTRAPDIACSKEGFLVSSGKMRAAIWLAMSTFRVLANIRAALSRSPTKTRILFHGATENFPSLART
jgi:hypothetical protein